MVLGSIDGGAAATLEQAAFWSATFASSWRMTYHQTATAATASTSRKISGGSGRRPLRGRTGGRSVRSVTVTLLGGTRQVPGSVGWSLEPETGPRWHRRPARR